MFDELYDKNDDEPKPALLVSINSSFMVFSHERFPPLFLPAAKPSGPLMVRVVLVVGKADLGDSLGLPSFLHLTPYIFFGVGSFASSSDFPMGWDLLLLFFFFCVKSVDPLLIFLLRYLLLGIFSTINILSMPQVLEQSLFLFSSPGYAPPPVRPDPCPAPGPLLHPLRRPARPARRGQALRERGEAPHGRARHGAGQVFRGSRGNRAVPSFIL